MKNLAKALQALVRSRSFFVATLVLLIIESVWIALSARYPMAFDEGYHLGIIKIFAHQWSPLILHQPPGPAPFGDLTRYPSFLYHWLMSFPYRLLHIWLSDQTTIIAMRCINIAFFAAGLVLFRELLLKTKASRGVVHVTLLFFVLVPIVPLLAGQINYDNLLMLVLPLNLLMVVRFREELLKKRLRPGLLLSTFSLALIGALIVFPYLPILTAITLYLLYLLWNFARLPRHKLWRDVRKSWRIIPRAQKIAVAALFLMSTGLFVETYGINLVQYHDITPQCGQVLSVQQCMSFGPWARNYHYAQDVAAHGRPHNYSKNPLVFLGGWVQGMFMRSFFTINGPDGPEPYQNFRPLPLISFAAMATLCIGILLLWRFRRDIFSKDPVLIFLLFVSFAYIVALLGKNYYGYNEYGRLVAINGRYLLLVILPIMLAVGMAYRQFLSVGRQALILGLVFLIFLQGGGAITFIVQSNAAWYWPHDAFALRLNKRAQKVIWPLTFDWPKR
jgi:hypothetical protein